MIYGTSGNLSMAQICIDYDPCTCKPTTQCRQATACKLSERSFSPAYCDGPFARWLHRDFQPMRHLKTLQLIAHVHTHMGMHIVHKYSHILACFSRSSYLSLLKPELAFCRRHVGLVTKSVTVLWINALVVK